MGCSRTCNPGTWNQMWDPLAVGWHSNHWGLPANSVNFFLNYTLALALLAFSKCICKHIVFPHSQSTFKTRAHTYDTEAWLQFLFCGGAKNFHSVHLCLPFLSPMSSHSQKKKKRLCSYCRSEGSLQCSYQKVETCYRKGGWGREWLSLFWRK